MNCPRCNTPLDKAIAMNGNTSEFWYACPRCNTYYNSYRPQAHQQAVHLDAHKYIGNFGAYGTGKTLTSRQEIYKHLFITQNANILVGAKTTPQYEQTLKRELENDIPKDFIAHVSVQKSYIEFINGARIIFRPFDDPDKLRSYNLTMFVIIEASETPAEALHQLKTRLRNLNATNDKADWRKGIIESNPDPGWIRSDIVLNSDVITRHGQVKDDIVVHEQNKDKFISTHVASTDVNKYLPATFIEEMSKNKPAWWIQRYIYSSFSYAEGLVYPNAPATYVPYFNPPKEWPRILAADYGLADNFVFLIGALDEKNGMVYIYKEAVTNNRNIDELAKLFYEITADIPVGGWYTQPLMDPKSGAKRDYNKKTLYDHFLDKGIFFKPGHIQLDARIFRTNTYIESDRLKIMNNCTYLITELEGYKFPERSLEANSRKSYKPVDKNNHAINPLEWICMELPADPSKIMYGAYNRHGDRIDQLVDVNPENPIPWQLQTDDSNDGFLLNNLKEMF